MARMGKIASLQLAIRKIRAGPAIPGAGHQQPRTGNSRSPMIDQTSVMPDPGLRREGLVPKAAAISVPSLPSPVQADAPAVHLIFRHWSVPRERFGTRFVTGWRLSARNPRIPEGNLWWKGRDSNPHKTLLNQ